MNTTTPTPSTHPTGGPLSNRIAPQAYVLLVLGLQDGFAVDLLGFQQVERVEAGVLVPANA